MGHSAKLTANVLLKKLFKIVYLYHPIKIETEFATSSCVDFKIYVV